MKVEKELEQKGYRIMKIFEGGHSEEAKKYARQLRGSGYRARVIKCGTNVIGLYDYVVWGKEKEVK